MWAPLMTSSLQILSQRVQSAKHRTAAARLRNDDGDEVEKVRHLYNVCLSCPLHATNSGASLVHLGLCGA